MRSPGIALLIALVVAPMAACDGSAGDRARRRPPAAVEVKDIERGPIELKRTYSGTLEAHARFSVASRISGRVDRVLVDLGDPVHRGQVIARLDDAELAQLVRQRKAALTVARARRTQATSARSIARRALARAQALQERGVSSQAQLDEAQAEVLRRDADIRVAVAEVARADAAYDAAQIRHGFAQVTADWSQGDDDRVVSARLVSPGALVRADSPILTLVELAPLTCVVFVAERDYRFVRAGLQADLLTDAFPGQTFTATVERVAPAFEAGSRQARVELILANDDGRLRPGMFVRATLVLRTVDIATIVPLSALTTRGDERGVFWVEGDRVTWRPVTVGVRDGERVQLTSGPGSGRVVTLGQQLLSDGAPIVIPGDEAVDSP